MMIVKRLKRRSVRYFDRGEETIDYFNCCMVVVYVVLLHPTPLPRWERTSPFFEGCLLHLSGAVSGDLPSGGRRHPFIGGCLHVHTMDSSAPVCTRRHITKPTIVARPANAFNIQNILSSSRSSGTQTKAGM